jgi:hypothetical protein
VRTEEKKNGRRQQAKGETQVINSNFELGILNLEQKPEQEGK